MPPILPNPPLHNPSLQRPLLNPEQNQPLSASHVSPIPHFRHLDPSVFPSPHLRRVQYCKSAGVPAGVAVVCGGVGAFHERVVGIWDGELGERVGGAGGGCEFELGMDGLGVGGLRAVNRGGCGEGTVD